MHKLNVPFNPMKMPTSYDVSTPAPPQKPSTTPENSEPNWNLMLGKVLDTLKHDYPVLLIEPLQTDIYHPKLELRDEHGLLPRALVATPNPNCCMFVATLPPK